MNSLDIIFSAVLQASWQAAVMAVIVLVVVRLLRGRLPARWRYLLWMPVVIRLLLPALPPSPVSIHRVTAPPAVVGFGRHPEYLASAPRVHSLSAADSGSRLAVAPAFDARAFLAGVWMAGVAAMAAYGLLANLRFQRRLRTATPAAAEDVDLLDSCAREIGMRRAPGLLETTMVQSPAVMGLFRPRVLLPAGYSALYTRRDLRFIFLHELAHLRRGDVVMNAVLAFTQCLHWFNPVIWYASARMRADREAATDACVLDRPGADERAAYGGTLLTLTQSFSRPGALPGTVGILEGRSVLRRRIEEIANFTHGSYRWSFFGFACILALSVLGLTGANSADPNAEGQPPAATAGKGKDRKSVKTITSEEAAQLEEKLRVDPSDVASRLRLLKYYGQQYSEALPTSLSRLTPEDEEKLHKIGVEQQRLMLWMVENAPQEAPNDYPYVFNLNAGAPEEAAYYDAWRKQVEKFPNDPRVLMGAGQAWIVRDSGYAAELFQRGLAIEPENAEWKGLLSHAYDLRARFGGQGAKEADPEKSLEFAKKALGFAEQAMPPDADASRRLERLPDLARLAFNAEQYRAARMFATEMLESAAKDPKNSFYGNAIFTGHDILGRLALLDGDVEEATRQLLLSADTPGSPTLNSFGPDLTLVQELIKKGQTEAAIAFFEKAAKFWKMYRDEIPKWQEKIRKGEELPIRSGMMMEGVSEIPSVD